VGCLPGLWSPFLSGPDILDSITDTRSAPQAGPDRRPRFIPRSAIATYDLDLTSGSAALDAQQPSFSTR